LYCHLNFNYITMFFQLLLAVLVAVVCAEEKESPRRRPLCGGLCVAVAPVVIGKAIEKKGKRRRMENGEIGDTVCTRTMKIVRESPFLKGLLEHEGEDNHLPLDNTVEMLKEKCALAAKMGFMYMNQCTFYVSMAQYMGEEFLEGVWLRAFGSLRDQMAGCAAVVNRVNAGIDAFTNVRQAELENGQEVFITGDESMSFRRLISAGASGIVGAGMYLAHICRSFDENNNVIQEEFDMSFD